MRHSLHAVLRDLRSPLFVLNVQHDEIHIFLVGLLYLRKAALSKVAAPLIVLQRNAKTRTTSFAGQQLHVSTSCGLTCPCQGHFALCSGAPAMLLEPAPCKPRTSLRRIPEG